MPAQRLDVTPAVARKTVKQHIAIAAAVEARNVAGAADEMEEHLDHVLRDSARARRLSLHDRDWPAVTGTRSRQRTQEVERGPGSSAKPRGRSPIHHAYCSGAVFGPGKTSSA
jgi:hypothetical protein